MKVVNLKIFVCAWLMVILLNSIAFSQVNDSNQTITLAVSEKFSTFDTLTSTASDAAADRIRVLIFDSLVKKDENFDYTGELANEITTSADGKAISFILRGGEKFHNGRILTAQDVKYTFDELIKSNSYKSGAFFETIKDKKVPIIVSIETPDAQKVVFNINKASSKNQLLSSLVSIPIIPEDTIKQQETNPLGSGAFKFVSFDAERGEVELESNADYWDGAPQFSKLRIKTVADAKSLQAKLEDGGVDIAPLPFNLSPDTINSLAADPQLKVEQFDGANIVYLSFNTHSPVLENANIRRAIAYAIDRQKIIDKALIGQATPAYSFLPVKSWAYFEAEKYDYNPEKARQIIKQAGYRNQAIMFKISSGNIMAARYAQLIQDSLKAVGLKVELETIDPNTLRQQLLQGDFQMSTGTWIGGNQDPVFYRDLFSTAKISDEKTKVTCCNRSRYSNPKFDAVIEKSVHESDHAAAKILYTKAQKIVSYDLPLMPLWYPANIAIVNNRLTNVKINQNSDWKFIKDLEYKVKKDKTEELTDKVAAPH